MKTAQKNKLLVYHSPHMISTVFKERYPKMLIFTASFKWYEWIKVNYHLIAFPFNNFVLGRYLLPSIDVHSALIVKILKMNGKFFCQSKFRIVTGNKLKAQLKINEESSLEMI